MNIILISNKQVKIWFYTNSGAKIAIIFNIRKGNVRFYAFCGIFNKKTPTRRLAKIIL